MSHCHTVKYVSVQCHCIRCVTSLVILIIVLSILFASTKNKLLEKQEFNDAVPLCAVAKLFKMVGGAQVDSYQ